MSFNIDELMTGVGIVIDDAISNDKDKKDDIFKIISQIEEKKIPLVKYSELPDASISHFKNLNFILLDWNLNQIKTDATEPVSVPAGLEESNIEQNIEFIKKIKETCFIPFFIFTKENTGEIITKLENAGLYSSNQHNFIFVENKLKLKNKNGMFNKVAEWLKETLSIYVLKEWELTLNKVKNELFWDFYGINQEWPKILWKAYEDDSVNMSNELGELITRNLIARMTPFTFESDIIGKGGNGVSKKDIRKIMEGERFIKQVYLDKNEIHTGDIFREKYNDNTQSKYRYWLNIRPQCDLIPRNDKKTDSIKLYLLEGEPIDYPASKSKLNGIFNIKDGNFREQINSGILFPVDDSIIKFSFRSEEHTSELQSH